MTAPTPAADPRDLDSVTRQATPATWRTMAIQAGYQPTSDPAVYRAPDGRGYLKLAVSTRKSGIWVGFLNGPNGRGPVVDAVDFAWRVMGLPRQKGEALVLALVAQEAVEYPQTGGEGSGPARGSSHSMPPSGGTTAPALPPPRAGLMELAGRMTQAGIYCDHLALWARAGAMSEEDKRVARRLLGTVGANARVHPQFQPAAYSNGRWYSPLHGLPKALRWYLGAGPGCRLLHADLVAAGVVALAARSRIPLLLQAAASADPYASLYESLTGRPMHPSERPSVKDAVQRALHGGAYTSGGPAQAVNWSLRRALQPWMGSIATLKEVTEPLSGRTFLVEGRPAAATALMEQSLVAAHIDSAMLLLEPHLGALGARFLTNWHDAFHVEVPEGADCQYVADLVAWAMATPFEQGPAGPLAFRVRLTWRSNLADGPSEPRPNPRPMGALR